MRRKRPAKGSSQGLGMSNELMMLTGMSEWRQQHPTATLREIEEAMDARLCQRCSTPEVRAKWQYLLQRHSQMQYPRYQAAGWPIGSGMVESANKLVVEARLKGAGRHWKRENVNPMLLLRNAVCNDR